MATLFTYVISMVARTAVFGALSVLTLFLFFSSTSLLSENLVLGSLVLGLFPLALFLMAISYRVFVVGYMKHVLSVIKEGLCVVNPHCRDSLVSAISAGRLVSLIILALSVGIGSTLVPNSVVNEILSGHHRLYQEIAATILLMAELAFSVYVSTLVVEESKTLFR